MHIYTALASGGQNLCIFTQLSLPGSRIYAYLRSSRFRLSESMYIYVALASWSRIYAYLRSSRFRGAESMHIYTALASQMQRGVASGAGGEAKGNGGLHQARAGKIVFASSRLGANRKDCVCIEPARCKRKRLCCIESARCKQKRLRLHRAGCICIEHNQLTCQPVGQTTTTRATRKLLEMLVFTRVSGFTVNAHPVLHGRLPKVMQSASFEGRT